MLARDFGFRPQGKSNPMRSEGGDRRSSSARSSSSTAFHGDHSNSDGLLFSDVFGGPPRYSNKKSSSSINDLDYDSIFKSSSAASANSHQKNSSAPVYDKPVYDEDIFDGLPGLTSKSASSVGRFEDAVFASMASPPRSQNNNSTNGRNDQFGDLLGKLGRNERNNSKSSSSPAGLDDLLGNLAMNERVPEGKSSGRNSSSRAFDDLLDGFPSSSPANSNRYSPYI